MSKRKETREMTADRVEELARYTTSYYGGRPFWELRLSASELGVGNWRECALTYDGFPANMSHHYGNTPEQYQTVGGDWIGMWVELSRDDLVTRRDIREGRPATPEQSVRLVEAIARTVQKNGWNDPDKIRAIDFPLSRVDAVIAKTLADCALEHVWSLIVNTAEVSAAFSARYRDAKWRISHPSSPDMQRPLLPGETRDSSGLVHVVPKPNSISYYQSGNRRDLGNPRGR